MNSWLKRQIPGRAVHATGRKKVVVAGLWTEACVMFPTLDMLNEGFEIYIPADRLRRPYSVEAHNRSMDRMTQAGAVPITSCQYVFELATGLGPSPRPYDGVMEILKAHSPLRHPGAFLQM